MKLTKTPSLYIRAFVSIVTLVLLNAGWVALSFVYGERMQTVPFALVIHFLWFVVMLIPMIVLGRMVLRLLHTMKVQNLNVANDTNNVHLSNKPSAAKLSSNEEYLRSLLDSAAMYVVRVDLHGNYTYLNRSFLETFVADDDRENIIGLSSSAYIIPEDQAGMMQAIDQCVANPTRLVQVELRKPALDGTIYTTEWKFALVQNTNGTNVEIQCSGLNVTERKRLETQLRVEQENTAELMNTINSIVWEADAETFQFMYVTEVTQRYLDSYSKRVAAELVD
jgi:PAS domain S-box-containing protein